MKHSSPGMENGTGVPHMKTSRPHRDGSFLPLSMMGNKIIFGSPLARQSPHCSGTRSHSCRTLAICCSSHLLSSPARQNLPFSAPTQNIKNIIYMMLHCPLIIYLRDKGRYPSKKSPIRKSLTPVILGSPPLPPPRHSQSS